MTMDPQEIGTIPEETRRKAQAACPRETLAMHLRDGLEALSQDAQCIGRSPLAGHPGDPPWRLAVGTVLQDTENLTDRHAANAVRERSE
jgi:hypothetical protein